MASLFHVFFLLSFSLAVCRKDPSESAGTTTILDVAAALKKSTQALAFDPRRAHQQLLDKEELTTTLRYSASTADLLLQLYSRDFLPLPNNFTTTHRDYESLTLARLRRDSARVRSIAARVAFAIDGSNSKPAKAAAMLDSIQGTIVSGNSQGSGEYFSRVGIGRPAKPQFMVLDTGSDINWVQCQPCTDCYKQADPIYDPTGSDTYAPLRCSSEPCHSLDYAACRNATCRYEVVYGDGSFSSGELATETLTIGDAPPVTNVPMGCGFDNEGIFVAAGGLLALGAGRLSFPSHLPSHSFTYCLVDRDTPGTSTIDFGPPTAQPEASTITTKLLRSKKIPTFYYVELTGISVGGTQLPIPPSALAIDADGSGGVIVDSGTAVSRLNMQVYEPFRDAFVKGTRHLPPGTGPDIFDACYNLSAMTKVQVPSVSFHFGEGKVLKLRGKNFLLPVDSKGNFCLAFAKTSSPLNIIGNVQHQGMRVVIAVENSMVSFTPNKC
ncbi:protein ASPARTIC PROTEASE IN GUARD CELL 1 [Phoenix dactylifera]|uniref:Protein ASPARTIC PROTEASE IN GUARD CELL 1 n=1 Tax=Phoenix dactylifera TaxID=42345 RepID=A0A8B7C3Y4_PHODC|nr:protein ASPARTIC PROTEASE IN GUARD CELL 1 [Phoenix dactylifera]